MAYAVQDLKYSLERVSLPSPPNRCIAAFGRKGDACEWKGGFLLGLENGQFALLTGWCDTTGWGCQDGTQCQVFDKLDNASEEFAELCVDIPVREIDFNPDDLNKFLRERTDDL